MICSVIGCGETASKWDGSGYSIGVNDCWKYGLTTDRLIVVNNLAKWPDRQKVVMASTPKDGLFSHVSAYCRHKHYKHIGSWQRWSGRYKPGVLYYSYTSPFIAVSMAHNLGYKEIVLYGVDFVDHPNVRDGKLKSELRQYESFFKVLEKEGTIVYLGVKFGALTNLIPVI